MAKKNKNMIWIIIIIVGIYIFSKGGVFTGALVCSSNEPSTIQGFHDLLVNQGYTIIEARLEPMCDPQFPSACIGPVFNAGKGDFGLLVGGFPSFLDGPDIQLPNCNTLLSWYGNNMCEEMGDWFVIDDCSQCSGNCHEAEATVLTHSKTNTNYLIIQDELIHYRICSKNNMMIIQTNDLNKYVDDFYTCQEETCTDGDTQICNIGSCPGTKTCSGGTFGGCVQNDPNCGGTPNCDIACTNWGAWSDSTNSCGTRTRTCDEIACSTSETKTCPTNGGTSTDKKEWYEKPIIWIMIFGAMMFMGGGRRS